MDSSSNLLTPEGCDESQLYASLPRRSLNTAQVLRRYLYWVKWLGWYFTRTWDPENHRTWGLVHRDSLLAGL